MAEHIYPLVFKPGILRDGTGFQGDYGIDGQWVRFQNNTVKTIGGCQQILNHNQNRYKFSIESLISFETDVQSFTVLIIRLLSDIVIEIYEKDRFVKKIFISTKTGSLDWERCSVLFSSPFLFNGKWVLPVNLVTDRLDMRTSSKNALYFLDMSSFDLGNKIQIAEKGENPNAGCGYFSFRLFCWGDNGIIKWSALGEPDNFKKEDSNGIATGSDSLSISSERLIYVTPVRGGANSPTFLVWTKSSVISISNVENEQTLLTDTKPTLSFQIGSVFRDTSLASRSSIVEYNGFFFWVGLDQFYVYNGIITIVPNSFNVNWFFENVNPKRLNFICGVANKKFNEVWWFYSDLRDEGNETRNTRAIVYNKSNDYWFDTIINRDSVFYDSGRSSFIAAGRAETNSNDCSVFAHETGSDCKDITGNILKTIPSSYTTGFISYVGMGPQKQEMGMNRFVSIKNIEPDFLMNDQQKINLSILGKKYAQSKSKLIKSINITSESEVIGLNLNLRQFQFKFSAESGSWEMGKNLISYDIGGENG